MNRRLWLPYALVLPLAAAIACLAATRGVSAQTPGVPVQQIDGRLAAGEVDAYLLKALAPGDRLEVTMETTSGNLDPAIGILGTGVSFQDALADYSAGVKRLLESDRVTEEDVDALRSRVFIAFDDDGGDGYASALEFVVPEAGDYVLVAGASLSGLGRSTWGEYAMQLRLDAAGTALGPVDAGAAAIAESLAHPAGLAIAVEVVTGTVTSEAPVYRTSLVALSAGDTLYALVEPASGDLVPAATLSDFGGKPVEASNVSGSSATAALEYTFGEDASGYTLEVRPAGPAEGGGGQGDFRLLVGRNAPDVLTGRATPGGGQVLASPIEVQAGVKILRISEVDSQNETFTVLGSLRMDWTDPELAFSPDSCDCSVKLYTDKEFDQFLADVESRWPAPAFFNQLGNRWIKSRAAAIWPDGEARYYEDFSTTFQADFEFRQYPFDTQRFPIYLDMVYPTTTFTLTDLPGYTAIDPDHGEDEFIITEFIATPSTTEPRAADLPVARMTYAFDAPRHLNYYVLQVFLPIALIILISWFTFFLRDYTRRIEASAANVLLFIAFSFSLADNYPRLGYMTFLDAVMTVTFAVNVLVLLYNVYMKRLETRGKGERVEHIDSFLDWIYPLLYVALIAFVVLLFF